MWMDTIATSVRVGVDAARGPETEQIIALLDVGD